MKNKIKYPSDNKKLEKLLKEAKIMGIKILEVELNKKQGVKQDGKQPV